MEDQSVIDHIVEMKGAISSLQTTIDETVKPLVLRVNVQENRLGAVENDVRVWKRVFGGLWGLVLVVGAATVNWLKGN